MKCDIPITNECLIKAFMRLWMSLLVTRGTLHTCECVFIEFNWFEKGRESLIVNCKELKTRILRNGGKLTR